MAKKRKLDKLDLEMIECEKDGFGVHYGRWKATQPIVKPVPVGTPDGLKECACCGMAFKPVSKNNKYCGAGCCKEATRERYKLKKREYDRAYIERKKARMEA